MRTVRHGTPLITRTSCGAAFGKAETGVPETTAPAGGATRMLPVAIGSRPTMPVGTAHCTGTRWPLSRSRTVRHGTPLIVRISWGAAFGKGELGVPLT